MKKGLIPAAIVLLALACRSGGGTDVITPVKDSTSVQILDTAFDFGKATEGEKVSFSYRFKNTGDKPLIIQNATASCGCTKPTWPTEPVPPGATATVKAEFNTEGRRGPAYKIIHVYSNAKPAFPPLKLTGIVVPKGS